MSIKQVKTFGDILDEIVDLAKLGTTFAGLSTDKQTSLKRKVNVEYQNVCFEKPYRWSGITRPLILNKKYTTGTGTLTFTNLSNTVTGTGTAWTSDLVGRKIKRPGHDTVYTIKRVNSTTSLTIDPVYIGATTTSSGYTIYKDEYGLFPDLQDIRSVRIQGLVKYLNAVGPNFIEDRRSFFPDREGNPEYFTIFGNNYYKAKTWATFLVSTDFWEDDVNKARAKNKNLIFWPGVFTNDLVAFIRYTMIPPLMEELTDEPILPPENRYRLVLDTLVKNFAKERDFVTKREWERLQASAMAKMVGDIETTDDELILTVDRTKDKVQHSFDYRETYRT